MDKKITSKELAALWDTYDLKNGGGRDGMLSLNELSNFLEDYVYSENGLYPLNEGDRMEDAKNFFMKGYDRNHDGKISKDEFINLALDLGSPLNVKT